jgi:MFS family permease
MEGKQKFYGWRIVWVLWIVYIIEGLVMYGIPVLNSFMVVETGMGRGILGLGASLYLIFQGLSGPFVGKSIKKYGVKFAVIVGAALIFVASILMAAVVDSPLGFLIAFGLLTGIGLGFSGNFTVQSGVNYWFEKRRGMAMSIVMTGAGIGGFAAGYILNGILSYTGGSWRTGWYFIAVTCIVVSVIALLFIINRPEDVGQKMDGGETGSNGLDKRAMQKKYRVYKTQTDTAFNEVLKDRRLWFSIIAICTLRFAYSLCTAHAILHLLDRGIPQVIAATALGTMTLVSVAGRLIAGTVSDWVESHIVWAGGMVIFIIGFLNLMFVQSSVMAVAFSVLCGFGFGAAYVCVGTMLANYYSPNTFPQVMGIVFPFQMVVGGLSPFTVGIIYDLTRSYTIGFGIGLAGLVIGTTAIILAVPPRKAGNITEKAVQG